MIVNDVWVSGEGFQLVIPTMELCNARELVQQLLDLRQARSTEPFAVFDGDNGIVGFCVPSLIRSAMIVPRTFDVDVDLARENLRLLRVQVAFYESQTRKGY